MGSRTEGKSDFESAPAIGSRLARGAPASSPLRSAGLLAGLLGLDFPICRRSARCSAICSGGAFVAPNPGSRSFDTRTDSSAEYVEVSAFVRYSACVATAEAVVRRSGLFLALRGLHVPREVPEIGGAFKESISRRLGRILPEMVEGARPSICTLSAAGLNVETAISCGSLVAVVGGPFASRRHVRGLSRWPALSCR
jgi:hypothetical protein